MTFRARSLAPPVNQALIIPNMRSTFVTCGVLVSGVVLALACGSPSGPGVTLEVTPPAVILYRNSSVQLAVSALDKNGHLVTGVAVSFASADTTIAMVTNVGLVQSRNVLGQTTIHVSGGGAQRDVPVQVVATPAAVVISPTDTTIFQNDSARFRAAVLDNLGDTIKNLPITFSSGDTSIATVSASGLARSLLRAGPTVIQASYGGFAANAQLTVRDTTILGNRVALAGQPYGAAVSATGVAYITLGSASQLARTNLPSQAFAPAVSVGSIPTEVAFNSTGAVAYVTSQSGHYVGVVNVASNTQVDTIPVNGAPFEVIVEPGDSIIYVSTNVNKVYGIRVATKQLVDSFPTPAIGNGMIIRDTLLYVSTHSGGTIIEFNLRTRVAARTFAVGGTPQKLALSADGNTLYIANQAGYVQFWDLTSGLQIGSNLLLSGSAGYGIALRPTTGRLYVTTAYFGGGGIYVINPATRTIVTSVIAGGSTRRVVFAANGVGFVPNESGWVDFIK